jgi:hypothetical protein
VCFKLLELVGFSPVTISSVQGVVSLVVDNIAVVADKVVHSEASEENTKEVDWQRPRLLRLTVVSAQHWPRCLGLLCFFFTYTKQ